MAQKSKRKPYHSLKAGGQNHKLVLTMNSIIEFEDEWGGSISEFGQKMNDAAPDSKGRVDSGAPQIKIGEIRTLLWAALLEHDEDVTLREAGRVMEEAGGFGEVMEPLMQALNDAFPSVEEDAGTREADKPSGKPGSPAKGPKAVEAEDAEEAAS